MSNLEGKDEVPFDYRAETQLPYNPSGLDTEGLVRTSSGEFWLAALYVIASVALSIGGLFAGLALVRHFT